MILIHSRKLKAGLKLNHTLKTLMLNVSILEQKILSINNEIKFQKSEILKYDTKIGKQVKRRYNIKR